ncbi:MAG: FecR domain-containing protein [Brevinematales bacterium]|nr:FecR domain-containing protein [Brevinematales bacterium]
MIKMTSEIKDLIYEIKRTKGHATGAIESLMGIYGKDFLREINYFGLPEKETKELVTSFFYNYIPAHFVDLSDRADFYSWGVGLLKQNAKRLHAMKKDEFKGRYEFVFAETDHANLRAKTFRTALSSVAGIMMVVGAVWLGTMYLGPKEQSYDLAKGGSASVENSSIVAVESSKYSVTKDGKNTTVKIQSGDLIFKVQHNDTTYKVETSLGDVTVVGTEFEVKFVSNAMTVNLYKGQVKITDKIKMTNVTLSTNNNQYFIYEKKNGNSITSKTNVMKENKKTGDEKEGSEKKTDYQKESEKEGVQGNENTKPNEIKQL